MGLLPTTLDSIESDVVDSVKCLDEQKAQRLADAAQRSMTDAFYIDTEKLKFLAAK